MRLSASLRLAALLLCFAGTAAFAQNKPPKTPTESDKVTIDPAPKRCVRIS